ncbi:kinase domain protein [Aspergillus steynii IBT 23096]|uniref:non-specific serine/threonine protein kinase n=1 Tax=Aspergillus steynii IBT 23096 TaxID=1392250 RepID=A0A2I2GF37_9EURO|nr:kinase domain protein [Aspergillus steynii IBT 23096]PLB51495.1 kinase domain protein [Aspergillus steynii IBT 23096]
MSLLRFMRSAPYKVKPVPAYALRRSQPIEEERIPHYDPKHFYPMQLHTTLANRYQVAAKLGWGTSSTVWLAKDLHQWCWLPSRYVAIKVNTNNYASQECAEKELRVTEHITRANPADQGRYFVRTLLDSFTLQGPHGHHICMVFDPFYEPLWMLKERFEGRVFPPDALRTIVRMIVMGLHYLHTQARVIHTAKADLKSDNIIMALRDQSLLDTSLGRPVITDFGLSVYGEKAPYTHPIQPNGFQAPEVILRASWDYSVDIWNLGALVWELLCGSGPFDYATSSSDSSYSEKKHLASIISSIGPPPTDMLKRERRAPRYFSDDGQFKFPDLITQTRGLDQLLTVIDGEEKRMFVKFITRLLQWQPKDRATVEELLSDPWLQQE